MLVSAASSTSCTDAAEHSAHHVHKCPGEELSAATAGVSVGSSPRGIRLLQQIGASLHTLQQGVCQCEAGVFVLTSSDVRDRDSPRH